MESPKLFMLLLGCKPPGRLVEQHDFFFGIAHSLKDLVENIRHFWPQPTTIHIDAWREVNVVDGYRINITSKKTSDTNNSVKLFFINLGGYTKNKFEEQHYSLLTIQTNKTNAIQTAKSSLFFNSNHFPGAESHIDDKYGIDVDDIYDIEEMLSPEHKEKFSIEFVPEPGSSPDQIHLGYCKLSSL